MAKASGINSRMRAIVSDYKKIMPKGPCMPIAIEFMRLHYGRRRCRPNVLVKALDCDIERGATGCIETEQYLGRDAVFCPETAAAYIEDGPCIISVCPDDSSIGHSFFTFPVYVRGKLMIVSFDNFYVNKRESLGSFLSNYGIRGNKEVKRKFRYCFPFDSTEYRPSYKFG